MKALIHQGIKHNTTHEGVEYSPDVFVNVMNAHKFNDLFNCGGRANPPTRNVFVNNLPYMLVDDKLTNNHTFLVGSPDVFGAE